MSITGRLQNTQISPNVAGISVACLLLLCVAGVLTVKNIVSGPPTNNAARSDSTQTAGPREPSGEPRASDGPTSKGAKVTIDGEEGDPCQLIAERNIFRPVAASDSGATYDQRSNSGFSANSLSPLPVSGFSAISMNSGSFGDTANSRNIAFTGVVETPEGRMALLENTSTSETRFAAVGDYVFGMEVVEVDSRSCSLDYGGSTITLALGENKSDTSANSNRGQQQQQQPRAPSFGRQQSASTQSGSQSQSDSSDSQSQNQGPGGGQDSGGNFGPPGGGPGGFGGPPPGFMR